VPHVLIEIRRGCTADEEVAMMQAVHDALRHAFRIPAADRHVRLIAHLPHRFAVPPKLSAPERFVQVSIDAFAGRSIDAKRTLYMEIVQRLGALGIEPDHVSVLVRESSRENWGIRGGRAASDVDLGFEVEV
jgi:phenylpyruvate tautomerase PptA (4-oxalocrotonate tautomerase family)